MPDSNNDRDKVKSASGKFHMQNRRGTSTVTVEVRRKKSSLLDRKIALEHKDHAFDRRKGRESSSERLTDTEINARISALKRTSEKPEARISYKKVWSQYKKPNAETPLNYDDRVQNNGDHRQSHTSRVETTERKRSFGPEDRSYKYSNKTYEKERFGGSGLTSVDKHSNKGERSNRDESDGKDWHSYRDRPGNKSGYSSQDRSDNKGGYSSAHGRFDRKDGYSSRDRAGNKDGYNAQYRSGSNEYNNRDRSDNKSEYSGKSRTGFNSGGLNRNQDGPPWKKETIILRDTSYGPRAKPQENETRSRFKKDVNAPKSAVSREKNTFRKRVVERTSFTASNENKSSKPVKVKKDQDLESLDQSRRKRTRSPQELSKKLSRNVLTRVMDYEEETRTRSLASYRRYQKKHTVSTKSDLQKVVRDVVIPDTITVGDLSNRMAISSALVIKSLMKMGILATINQVIDGDTAEIICIEFGHQPKRKSSVAREASARRKNDKPEDLLVRPPIITIMGHVDHGKTSLLDALRKTNVTATEFGGITQQIGAYQIVTPYSEAKITFFDTPGHAAFSEMRARGANVTDIVILVIAADDGVNEQTIEAIAHAKTSNAAIIVALNKIDKPGSDSQRVKHELLNHGVILEDFGGDVISVEISAKNGTNLDKLIEAILLQAEMLSIKASPKGLAEGVIVDAAVEKGRGIVATVLVQKGTLRTGDIFVAGAAFGRIKMMHDCLSQKITEAGPSCPVEILGLNGIPRAGDDFFVVNTEQKAREIAENRQQLRNDQLAVAGNKNSIKQMMHKIAEGDIKELNIIIKSDTRGALEAVESNISKLSVNGVTVHILHGAIGDINESDVMLAKTSKSCVFGFCVKASHQARLLADKEGIVVEHYSIIYELLKRIESIMKGLLAPKTEEKSLGKAELRVVFSKGKFIKIAGCYVLSGVVKRTNPVKIHRGNEIVFTGKIDTMKHEKDDIKEAKEGHECGIILDGFNGIQEGDIIESFELVDVIVT